METCRYQLPYIEMPCGQRAGASGYCEIHDPNNVACLGKIMEDGIVKNCPEKRAPMSRYCHKHTLDPIAVFSRTTEPAAAVPIY